MRDFAMTDKAFEFLSSREKEDRPFTFKELAAATGWKLTTIYTYYAKHWRPFIISFDCDFFRASGIVKLGKQGFRDLQRQIPRKPPVIAKADEGPKYDYEVALSFAGEDRATVEELASFLRSMQISVFYDAYEQADLWGKNLYDHLSDIYKNKAKYCVIFASRNYKEQQWTNH